MLISISLGIMISLAIFSFIVGGSFETINTDLFSNTGAVDISGIDGYFYISDFNGAIMILVFILVLIIIMGIQIFGFGLSSHSIKIASICIIYVGIWLMFTTLSLILLIEIEIYGFIIYIILTILYTMGVILTFISE